MRVIGDEREEINVLLWVEKRETWRTWEFFYNCYFGLGDEGGIRMGLCFHFYGPWVEGVHALYFPSIVCGYIQVVFYLSRFHAHILFKLFIIMFIRQRVD